MRLTDSDLKELIYERVLPDDFSCGSGIEEKNTVINHRFGEAFLDEIWFEGIHIMHGRVKLEQGLLLKAESDQPVIEMHFNLAGDAKATVFGGRNKFNFKSRQHNLYYLPEFDGYFEAPEQTEHNDAFEVHFSERYFQRLASSGSDVLSWFADTIQQKKMSFISKTNMNITGPMMEILQQVLLCNKQGVMKRLFLEARVLELLMLQMEQFESAKETTSVGIKPYDIEKLHHAKFLVEQNVSNPHSLAELSRLSGLNDFKLKKGFKQLFGHTVFGYLHEIRMQKAKKMLLDCNTPIVEVSAYCGYEYVQHFTTAFRKRFGITPGGFRT
ncbi:HTH-type transcriptional activator RhaR [Dyadobacter sp. CECT 9275]|uniref:HTH-type transcriptional activator RhaR n=2 Tax=Dyadobacter helix TaxID=2822344 RepID=A0A916JIN8_9BACT|nr:HTH-type transcriptional activator RhaR [Dyadobacter sp. CECT 9275]